MTMLNNFVGRARIGYLKTLAASAPEEMEEVEKKPQVITKIKIVPIRVPIQAPIPIQPIIEPIRVPIYTQIEYQSQPQSRPTSSVPTPPSVAQTPLVSQSPPSQQLLA